MIKLHIKKKSKPSKFNWIVNPISKHQPNYVHPKFPYKIHIIQKKFPLFSSTVRLHPIYHSPDEHRGWLCFNNASGPSTIFINGTKVEAEERQPSKHLSISEINHVYASVSVIAGAARFFASRVGKAGKCAEFSDFLYMESNVSTRK